jgi:hypothetical protein
MAALSVFVLGGCQTRLTLEEAQARCTKQGGFLVIIHSQKISRAGAVGPDEPSPGDCISPDKFDAAAPGAPAPAKAPPN